jgi:hypothetical protein
MVRVTGYKVYNVSVSVSVGVGVGVGVSVSVSMLRRSHLLVALCWF